MTQPFMRTDLLGRRVRVAGASVGECRCPSCRAMLDCDYCGRVNDVSPSYAHVRFTGKNGEIGEVWALLSQITVIEAEVGYL